MNDNTLIVESILQEMAYPTHFSFDELRSMRSFAAKMRYCEQHLTKIGAGSSRIAYRVDDEKVLKLAKNAKGLAQNSQESSMGSDDLDIFAKTFESADDDTWVEMEIARKPKPTEFKKIFGINIKLFESIMYALGYWSGCLYENRWGDFLKTRAREGERILEQYCCEDDEPPFYGEYNPESGMTEACWNFFSGVVDWMHYYSPSKAEIGDATRLANLGIVTREGKDTIVIIDFGINEVIFNQHYRRA